VARMGAFELSQEPLRSVASLNIPPERIKELAPQLLPNKGAEIVTYCTSLH
jgi:hypothetical protein